jgi:amino acid transporter
MTATSDAAVPVHETTGGGLHRRLSSFGCWLLALSCLSPVLSVYGVGADVLSHAGTGAAILFLLGLGAALVWGFVYAELGSAYPHAGGDYVGVGRILGGWAGAATLALWLATCGPSTAFMCHIVATYVGELVPGIPANAVVFGALVGATLVGLLAVRTSAIITGVFVAVEMVAIALLIGTGFYHPARGAEVFFATPMAPGGGGLMAPVALGILASALVNTAYGTVGGNQALYFGEELRDPHRKMGKVVLWAALTGGLCTALSVIAVVLGARDLPTVLGSAAPLAAFVSERIGPGTARALSAAVALAIFNALIAQTMVNGRLLFSVARDGLLPGAAGRLLARVAPGSGTPRAATIAMTVFAGACCLLGEHILLVFISGLIVYGWGLVCLAVLVGRAKGLTGGPGFWRAPLHPLAAGIGLLMALGFAIANLADADAGRPSLILLGLVVLAAIAWYWRVLRPRGWLPSITDLG